MWNENSRARAEAQQRICHINICLYIFYWINIYTKHWRFLVKISSTVYIYFLLAATRTGVAVFTASLGFCMRCSPHLFNPYSPPSLIIFVRFCCGLFATVVFPFWQLARFVYLCLFKSNAEPAWLALPCLALAWLALAVLGLLKPSASLVCRLCHETLAPDGAEQNSWHWSWPEVGEHGPQPEYFISALCYSLCAHITQTRLNFCNFPLHSHKYI